MLIAIWRCLQTSKQSKNIIRSLCGVSVANDKSSRGGWKYLMVGSGLVGVAGACFLKKKAILCHHEENGTAVTDHNKIWSNFKIKLYQYQTCPFCSKTRSFLLAHDIPFESVEVHPIFKKEIEFSKYKKVPIVTIEKDGGMEQLNDSSLIMSVLSSFILNEGQLPIADILNLYPVTKQFDPEEDKSTQVILNRHWVAAKPQTEVEVTSVKDDSRSEEANWRAWADDHLVHLVSPNVYRTLGESLQAFDLHVRQGRFKGTWEGVVAKFGGGVAMWGVSKKLKKKYKLNENVRIDLYRACNAWTTAIGDKRKFMGGSKPNLADISVFGVLSVMEGLEVWGDLLTHTSIKKWYYRTKQAVNEHSLC